MFSLVEFENGECCVQLSRNVRKQMQNTCSSKYKGAWYAAKLVLESDDKTYLLEYKYKYKYNELLNKSSLTSAPMQLIPLINRQEIQNYINSNDTSNCSNIKQSSSSGIIYNFNEWILHSNNPSTTEISSKLLSNGVIQENLFNFGTYSETAVCNNITSPPATPTTNLAPTKLPERTKSKQTVISNLPPTITQKFSNISDLKDTNSSPLLSSTQNLSENSSPIKYGMTPTKHNISIQCTSSVFNYTVLSEHNYPNCSSLFSTPNTSNDSPAVKSKQRGFSVKKLSENLPNNSSLSSVSYTSNVSPTKKSQQSALSVSNSTSKVSQNHSPKNYGSTSKFNISQQGTSSFLNSTPILTGKCSLNSSSSSANTTNDSPTVKSQQRSSAILNMSENHYPINSSLFLVSNTSNISPTNKSQQTGLSVPKSTQNLSENSSPIKHGSTPTKHNILLQDTSSLLNYTLLSEHNSPNCSSLFSTPNTSNDSPAVKSKQRGFSVQKLSENLPNNSSLSSVPNTPNVSPTKKSQQSDLSVSKSTQNLSKNSSPIKHGSTPTKHNISLQDTSSLLNYTLLSEHNSPNCSSLFSTPNTSNDSPAVKSKQRGFSVQKLSENLPNNSSLSSVSNKSNVSPTKKSQQSALSVSKSISKVSQNHSPKNYGSTSKFNISQQGTSSFLNSTPILTGKCSLNSSSSSANTTNDSPTVKSQQRSSAILNMSENHYPINSSLSLVSNTSNISPTNKSQQTGLSVPKSTQNLSEKSSPIKHGSTPTKHNILLQDTSSFLNYTLLSEHNSPNCSSLFSTPNTSNDSSAVKSKQCGFSVQKLSENLPNNSSLSSVSNTSNVSSTKKSQQSALSVSKSTSKLSQNHSPINNGSTSKFNISQQGTSSGFNSTPILTGKCSLNGSSSSANTTNDSPAVKSQQRSSAILNLSQNCSPINYSSTLAKCIIPHQGTSSVLNFIPTLSEDSSPSNSGSTSTLDTSNDSPAKKHDLSVSKLSENNSSKISSYSSKSTLSDQHSFSNCSVSSTSSSFSSLSTYSIFPAKKSIQRSSSARNSSRNLSTLITPIVSVSKNVKTDTNNVNLQTSLKSPSFKSNSLSVISSNEKDNAASESTCSKTTLNNTKTTTLSLSKTFSEYLPDSTIEITAENASSTANSFKEHETSVEAIKNPLKLSTVKVPHRSQLSKRHFCIFCKTLQCKLSRHFFLKHCGEKEVKEAKNLPIKSKERLKIIDKLRKQGNFLHNTSEEYNSGILIVSRQQQARRQNNVDDYACCKNCKGFFSKNTLRNHLSRCGAKEKNSRHNLINGRKLTQYVHAEANFTLRTKIFPVLRNDEVTRAIRYDELIIKYANKMTEKYTLTHQHDMIRSQLRLLGRFLIEVIKLDTNVKQLKDIFKPPLFDNCIKALRTVANWNDELMWFRTPAVAQSLTSLVKKCGAKQRSEYIKNQKEEAQKELENFLLLWEEEIPVLINKKAFDDQCNQKREKKVVLPTKNDIKKLYLYLKNKMLEAIGVLENKFDLHCWNELVTSSLIFIQIFNRRRAGEIERLSINSYLNKEIITENVENDILKKMSKESISFAKQFARLTLRGKLGRTVSVLLCPLSTSAVDLILKHRAEAGIPEDNEYIFSKKGSSKFSKHYYRACPLLKQFSTECGAEIPESLRGTFLRKHIATYTSLLNIEDATVDKLANFMGHHKDIHKNVYRVSVPVAEVTCVSKLLMAAIGDEEDEIEDDNFEQDNLEEENLEEDNLEEDTFEKDNSKRRSQNTSGSSVRKRRSTSPYGKTKRCKWTQEERQAIHSTFGALEKLERLPSTFQCLEAINKNSILKNRTPQQVKSWIDNQRRYKLKVKN